MPRGTEAGPNLLYFMLLGSVCLQSFIMPSSSASNAPKSRTV